MPPDADVRGLLLRQVTSPVRFLEAMAAAAEGIDLWIEAGPGRVLSGLAAGWVRAPVVAIEAGGESLRGLLRAAGAAFALGAPLEPAALFDGRCSRPFPIPLAPRFFANPCELAPLPGADPPRTGATVGRNGTDGSSREREAVAEPARTPVPVDRSRSGARAVPPGGRGQGRAAAVGRSRTTAACSATCI